MSTVQETLIPAGFIPGMVTLELSDGSKRNFFPVDAKEILANGDAKLVENGAIEAARMAATPLRSGYASGIPSDQIIAEVAGVEGRIVAASSPEEAEEAIAAGDSPDENREPGPGRVGYEGLRDAAEAEFAATQLPAETAKPKPAPARSPAPSGGSAGAAKKDDDK